MKISCLQENLAKGLSIVGRAVASRSTLPVLSNVMLETDNGRLKLSTTNLELGINCWVGAKVEAEGATTVPARLLTDFINSLPPEQIDMELAVRTQTLNARCARFEANIKGIDAQEFPIIPTTDDAERAIRLEPEDLRQMIDQVVFAAATDESRPILTGVLARFDGDELTMAAADGFRLSVRSASLGQPVEEAIEVIIPARALGELARISPDQEDWVEVFITPARNQILFHMRDVDLVSQLIEGKFPDYRQIIPSSHTTRTVLDTSGFLKAARVSHLFARDAANIVRVEVAPGDELMPGRLTLAATSAELGDNVGQLDAIVEGDPIEIAFNAKYLIDVLSVMDTAQVAMETSSASSPGVLRPVGDDDFVHVIMPMHISR
ncbi:MAG: DNA polymerase III subunit beta [Anaerolineales bacterium]|nr:MAG: DNA polymerase III subunit beta [Anaerolineales bacterium]